MLVTFIITISGKIYKVTNYFFLFHPLFPNLDPISPKLKDIKNAHVNNFIQQDKMDLNLKFESFNSGYCVSFKLEYYLVKSDSTENGIPIPYISVSLTIALRLLHNCFNIPLFI